MILYLTTHEPSWLARSAVPLFLSRNRLARQGRVKPAVTRWALDSGGFTALSKGTTDPRTGTPYTFTTDEYAADVRRWQAEVGMLDWAAPMDWMCEPEIIAKHGKGVRRHQAETLENFGLLRDQLGGLVVPVLQGWTQSEYHQHVEMYDDAGFDLRSEPTVGVGSVCRRGQDAQIVGILNSLWQLGLRLHAFGVRGRALERIADAVVSADSLAWSYRARRLATDGIPPDHPHPRGGVSCANCRTFAERWHGQHLNHQRLDWSNA